MVTLGTLKSENYLSIGENDKMYKFISLSFFICLASFSAFGAVQGEDVGFILRNMTGSFSGIAQLLFTVCIVAGLSFGIAAMFKFKQHKDNPAQVSVGQAIGLFFLGALMLWMPFLIRTMGATITGGGSNMNQYQNKLNDSRDSGFGQWLIGN